MTSPTTQNPGVRLRPFPRRRDGGAALAAMLSCTAPRSIHAAAPPISVTLPPASPSAPLFSTSSVTFGPSDGLMYVWDAANVLRQHSFNSTQFDNIGSVPNGNNGDPGSIVFSGNGSQMLLSDGAGGNLPAQYNGVIFGLPAAGGAASSPVGTVAFNSAFAPLPSSSSQYFVDQGVLVGPKHFRRKAVYRCSTPRRVTTPC